MGSELNDTRAAMDHLSGEKVKEKESWSELTVDAGGLFFHYDLQKNVELLCF